MTSKTTSKTTCRLGSGVVSYTQPNRTIWHVRLPCRCQLSIRREIAVGSEAVREVIADICINSVIETVVIQDSDHRVGYVVQEDQIDCSVGRKGGREARVGFEKVWVIVIRDFGVWSVICFKKTQRILYMAGISIRTAISAEIIGCCISWCQRRLAANDASPWVCAFGMQVVMSHWWVYTTVDVRE